VGLIPGVDDAADHALVLALRARQAGAFERLYAEHSERIWRFLVRLAGGGADDLFQETWLAAARHAHRLRDDTRLLPWLFTVARNKHRNSLRSFARQARGGRELGEQDGATHAPLDDRVHSARQTERAAAAFARLGAAHREVLLLCVVEELDTATVARTLACREDAVRKRLSRARRELARLCGREEGDP
jgi:RNA polymerase sigma factor (sigma-70 family)